MYFTASPVVPDDDCVPTGCFMPGGGVVAHQLAWASLLFQPLHSLGCWRCKSSHVCSSFKAHRCPHVYLGSSNQMWPVQSHSHVTALVSSVSDQTHSMTSSCFVRPTVARLIYCSVSRLPLCPALHQAVPPEPRASVCF